MADCARFVRNATNRDATYGAAIDLSQPRGKLLQSQSCCRTGWEGSESLLIASKVGILVGEGYLNLRTCVHGVRFRLKDAEQLGQAHHFEGLRDERGGFHEYCLASQLG